MRNFWGAISGEHRRRRRETSGSIYVLALLLMGITGFAWLAYSLRASAATSPMHLVRLNVIADAGMVRIEITADGSFNDATIEQITRGRETVIRVRGARSALLANYAIENELARGVRTISSERDGEPFVDVVIATGNGATVAQKKNFNRLIIGIASDFARLRRHAPASPGAELARRETSITRPTTATATAPNARASSSKTSSEGVNISPRAEQVVNTNVAASSNVPAADSSPTQSLPVFHGRTIWSEVAVASPYLPPLNLSAVPRLYWQTPSSAGGAVSTSIASFIPMTLETPGASRGVWVPGTTTSVKDEVGGKPLGPGVLRPSFLFGARYDDNYFYRSTTGRQTGIFIFSPRLEYEVPGERRAFRFAYETPLRYLTKGKWLTSHFLDFDSRVNLTRSVRLSLRDHFVNSPLDPREYDPAGEVYIVGDTFTRNDAALRLEFGVNSRNRIAADIGYNIVDWSDNRIAAAPLFINYDELTWGATFEHDFSEQTVGLAQFSTTYTNSTAPLRPQFNGLSNGRRYDFELGLRTQMSATSGLAVRAGYERSLFHNAPGGNDFSGLIFDLTFRNNLTEKTAFEFASLRKTQVSTFNLEGGNARLVSTGASARVEHLLSEAWKLAVGANYQRLGFPIAVVRNSTASGGLFVGDFAGSFRTDNLYGFSAEAGYRWSEFVRSRLVYDFLRRDSTLPVLTFNRNRLSLVLEFGRRKDVRGRPF